MKPGLPTPPLGVGAASHFGKSTPRQRGCLRPDDGRYIVAIGDEIGVNHLILQNLWPTTLHFRRQMAQHFLLEESKRLQWFGQKSVSACGLAPGLPVVIGADPQNG